ncbi:20S-pre-rRNA D-site endonuclease nob1 [Fusarium falciforme]|uniref:20S-pre-rRNA D-site endonuclease NOB1 n=1 Tax=Fusarium falciforme TaxID=195108 RepID=UPI0023014F5F|nr:20S-pre-rRNA D-site endonuclease NOB1 [Fusarium falciforme]KAJ4163071.1 20S-pre-rRNA D-site endonuclease nob1 [Fusarium falciforme]KAJ4196157.1 20S-pre-rRNA D-site endonuclease nob1 [Fusarium falciforme]KAJ4243053.1 20S-pre-rRNA D-site endonuclease nob1 [Fusarium falciforme]WAO92454.1 20S-pre-rRNA D-site endonuclease NOB1 [Fusarium falciforme]
MASSEELKPIHSLVLDTGPLIKNDPPANTLRAKAEQLYTLPCIISEIKDAATRSRVETTLLPFVTLRSPKPESVKVIREFARKTGDLAVLSKPDIEVLALGYELEIERNGGDWRLRSEPGQKGMNGRPPNKPVEGDEEAKESEATLENEVEKLNLEQPTAEEKSEDKPETVPATKPEVEKQPEATEQQPDAEKQETEKQSEPVEQQTEADKQESVEQESEQQPAEDTQPSEDDSEASDDEGGWITPSNLKKKQAATSGSTPSAPVQKTLQAAVLTSDYAMQNVALRMGLNLVAPSLARITHLKNWVLRCHGCFKITKDMSRQFCPSCGQPTLMRASCSTDQFGNFTIHLKKNFQWNNRGNVYSVPKPVHGSANGRLPKNAGGKNNWGNNLILSEDQKEFTRASDDQRRQRKKDIMDQDYLPDLLSGHRSGGNGKIRVGAGRNVNSKRKH